MYYLILLAIGLFAGYLAGLLGVGGGIIFTPILLYLFVSNSVSDPVSFTIATSLLCTLSASLSSSVKHFKSKNNVWKEGIWIGFGGIFGTYFGKILTTSEIYDRSEFSLVFGLILIYTSYNFLMNTVPKTHKKLLTKEAIDISLLKGLLIGILGGFVASIAGLGGGVVVVPILSLIFYQPYEKTVGVSSFTIVIITFSATLQYALFSNSNSIGLTQYTLGYVDFGTALPIILGTIFSAQLGVKHALMVNQRILKRLFAVLLLIVAIRMLFGVFG